MERLAAFATATATAAAIAPLLLLLLSIASLPSAATARQLQVPFFEHSPASNRAGADAVLPHPGAAAPRPPLKFWTGPATSRYRPKDHIIPGADAITAIYTRKQRVTRLRDPRAYLSQRASIIEHARSLPSSSCDPDALPSPSLRGSLGGEDFSAASALDWLHTSLDWEEDDLLVPDVTRRSTLLALARMSSAAYESPPDPPTWRPTPGFEGWNVSESFGWVEDGIRGHVFASPPGGDEGDDAQPEVVVVALKGTSAALLPGGDDTSRRDKLNVRRGCWLLSRLH